MRPGFGLRDDALDVGVEVGAAELSRGPPFEQRADVLVGHKPLERERAAHGLEVVATVDHLVVVKGLGRLIW